MKGLVSPPIESTQIASLAVSSAYGLESNYQPATMSNTGPIPPKGVRHTTSVEATVSFIRANYDSLFRKLAD
jgi:hypothetical protein